MVPTIEYNLIHNDVMVVKEDHQQLDYSRLHVQVDRSTANWVRETLQRRSVNIREVFKMNDSQNQEDLERRGE